MQKNGHKLSPWHHVLSNHVTPDKFVSLPSSVRHGYPWVPTDQAHGRPRQVGPAY
jgi:hypothetical protein